MRSYINAYKLQSSTLISIGIFVVLIVFSLFAFLFYSNFKKSVLRESFIEKIDTYVNLAKGFSLNSLILSSNLATVDVAAQGGYISDSRISDMPRTWICNELNIPSVSYVSSFLSQRTQHYLNMYLQNFNKEMQDGLITINISNFTCVYYDANDSSVLKGGYDEYFNVSALGSLINATGSDGSFISINNQIATVSQNRFWFLYSNIEKWLKNSGYSEMLSIVCSCLSNICYSSTSSYRGHCKDSGSSFCGCVKNGMKNVEKDLNEYFKKIDDGKDYVKCKIEVIGCYEKKSPCPSSVHDSCVYWSNPEKCNYCYFKVPHYKCPDEVSRYIIKKSAIYKGYVSYQMSPSDDEKKHCESYDEVYGSTEFIVKCTDRKYYLSTPDDRKLTFEFHGRISMHKTGCFKIYDCKKTCDDSDCHWVPASECCTECH